MLQVARLAPKLLGDSAELVRDFLLGQLGDDGGFRDRQGATDLYYTVFGIEGLVALRADLPAEKIAGYLRGFGEGAELDFVHLTCLARCWAGLPRQFLSEAPAEAVLRRIETYRTGDGGYNADDNAQLGSVYGCFLAAGAYQDLGRELPQPQRMLECIESQRAEDGGYANRRDMPQGLTPSTAAAATLLRYFGAPLDTARLRDWLLARCRDGGFFALAGAPMPDLLSTATALHALTGLHAVIAPIRDPCLDFIDSLWSNRGAFHGNWTDDEVDCEYTYYGLLALGHLSL